MGCPNILADSTQDQFAEVLLGLLDTNDPNYRTELIIRYSIPRDAITNKDLPGQVGLVADALLRVQKPLAFLMSTGKAQPDWRWEEGVVDDGKEHIELRHGDASKTPYENWSPIARIGKPNERLFRVQWLVKSDSPENRAMLEDARWDLDYYLVKLRNDDPWAYAQYPCTTTANMYSSMHWSYFPSGRGGEMVSSMVIGLSAEESRKLSERPETDNGK